MIKIPKILAFFLFILMTILLAVSFTNINWQLFETNYTSYDVYITFRETLMFLILTIFFMLYYVRTLKKDDK